MYAQIVSYNFVFSSIIFGDHVICSSSTYDSDYPFGIFKLFFSFFALEMWYDHTEIIKLPYMYKALLEALYCVTIIIDF